MTSSCLTRRSFLGGAGVATATAAATGLTFAAADEVEVGTPGLAEGQYAFEMAPAPVDESLIKETVEADLCIVGGGQSGCSAALTAASLGARAVVLQKNPSVFCCGWAVRAINPACREPEDASGLLKQYSDANMGLADARILKLYIDYSGETVDFFNQVAESLGLEYRYVPHQNTKYVVWSDNSAYHRQNTFFTQTLPYSTDRGVEFRFNTAGYYLERDESGHATGVIAEDLENGGFIRVNASKGVVVCAGDIGGDSDMLAKYSSLAFGVPSAYAGGSNTGDGQKMLLWAGAQMQKYPYAPMIHLDPSVLPEGNAPFSDYPWLAVNCDGERFLDESTDYQSKIFNALCQREIEFFHIGGPAMKEYITGNVDVRNFTWDDAFERGAIIESDTLEGLAELIGVPAENLAATVERYNAMFENGEDTDFGKPMESFENTLVDMTGPFYAIKRSPGTLVVMGGAVCNPRLQVLDEESNPIEGLYAAGNNVARFYGMEYPIAGMGGTSNGRACTTGRLAARFALGDL